MGFTVGNIGGINPLSNYVEYECRKTSMAILAIPIRIFNIVCLNILICKHVHVDMSFEPDINSNPVGLISVNIHDFLSG